MSISIEERRDNFEEALRIATRQANDSTTGFVIIYPEAPEFTNIYPTTWSELESKHYIVRILNQKVFQLNGYGWLKGMQLLGQKENPAFQKTIGLLCAYLKNEVEGRKAEAFVGFGNLCSATGLSYGLIHYIIESRLIEAWHNVYGPIWHKRDELVLVPINFGLKKL